MEMDYVQLARDRRAKAEADLQSSIEVRSSLLTRVLAGEMTSEEAKALLKVYEQGK